MAVRMTRSSGHLAAALLATAWGAHAQAPLTELAQFDLTELSIDDLLEIEVVTVSKRAEPLFQAPAAVYAITGDEIRRSGARTLPDALRLVPGVEVAATGPRSAAITVRGFNETSADKLEVLIDGRSVYTPLTSAVFWEMLDVAFEDIERIEVVRGPGGTIWGANAVNGVVNIVTRSSFDTTGEYIHVGAGNEHTGSATLRLGQPIGERGAIRAYALAHDFDSTLDDSGDDARDSLRTSQAGFRTDWKLPHDASLTVAGDLTSMRASSVELGGEGRIIEDDRDGGNLNVRWSRAVRENGEISITSFVDWYRILIPNLFDENRRTYDFDARYRFVAGRIHEVTVGIGYRRSEDDTGGPPIAIFVDPLSRTTERPSAFIQDRVQLLDGRLSVTLGSKFEKNDFTGNEVQPSFRIGWLATPDRFIALSAARAIRTPNRFDEDIALFCNDGLAAVGFCEAGSNFRLGNPDIQSEQLTALELIFRQKFGDTASAELTLFRNDYENLVSTEANPPPFGSFRNELAAESWGGELAFNTALAPHLTLRSWLSFLDLEVDDSRSQDADAKSMIEGSSPEYQAAMMLRWSPGDWEIDTIARHVAELEFTDNEGNTERADAYTEVDLRVARRLSHGLTASLIGRNLAADDHAEFPGSDTRVERAVFFELSWHLGAIE